MSHDDPDAIWRSDDVPVPPPPDGPGPSAGRRAAVEPIVFDAPTVDGPVPPRRSTTVTVIAAAAVAAIVVVTAIVAVVASGSDDSTAPAVTEPSTVPGDSVADEPPERTDSPTTTTADASVPAAAEQLELPTSVAAISAPTEVLALTPNGVLHTLSLPSGRVRSVDLNAVSDASTADGFGSVVVAPDAAAVGVGGTRIIVVSRSGEAIDVDLGFGVASAGTNVEGWLRGEDGSTRFVVASYPAQGGDVDLFTVAVDGSVEELPVGLVPYAFVATAGVQGELIVNDAGGAYRVAADGTSERIEDGVVYAHDGAHRLVRECDASQQCSTVIVNAADGARRTIDPAVIPDDLRAVHGIVLSPDGTAASMLRSTARQERVIVDFDVGEVAAVPSDTWLAGSTWAADSSGVFDVAQGELQFVDRATGESATFAQGLAPFVAVGVRHPDAELPPDSAVVSTALTAEQPIAPTGLVLSAALRAGGMGVLSVDTLDLTAWRSPLPGRGSATLSAVGDGVLVLPADDESAFVTTPASDTMLGDEFTTDAPMLVGPSDDTIWVPDVTAAPTDVRYRLLRLDGTVADDLGSALVDVADASLLGSDGRGGLVVERRGDVFVVGVDGAVRLTSGELVAIGASTAYVRECESIADCTLLRIDRTSGTAVAVSAPAAVMDALGSVDAYRGAALGSTVSPDGEVLVSRLTALNGGLEPALQTVLFDTRTGDTTFVDDHTDDQPLVWNAESSFAALLAGSAVEVYDRAGDRTIELGGARLRAIGPAPGAP